MCFYVGSCKGVLLFLLIKVWLWVYSKFLVKGIELEVIGIRNKKGNYWFKWLIVIKVWIGFICEREGLGYRN